MTSLSSQISTRSGLATMLLAGSLMLSACGGGDDPTTGGTGAPAGGGGGGGGGGGSLTLSAANPTAHNTTLNLSTATNSGNITRAADGFSNTAYCEVYWENTTAANGKTYALQVYFRQSDKAPLHVSVVDSTGYVVFSNDSGNPITGLTVDTAAKTITFTNKVLAGGTGELGTLAGTAAFAANAGTASCGS